MDTEIGKVLFHHDQTIGVLICKRCHIAVNPKTLAAHLRSFHGNINQDTRRELAKSLSNLPVASCFEELALPSCPLAISYIPVKKGYKCPLCGKCLLAADSMTRHLRDHPKGASGSLSRVEILTQQIFAQPKICIEVQTAEEGLPPDPKPLEQFLKSAMTRYKEIVMQQEAANQSLPINVEAASLTPWLSRTGWVEHLGGLDPKRLKVLTILPENGGGEAALEQLCGWMIEVLKECQAGVRPESCPTTIRCMVSAHTTTEIGMRPERFDVQEATLSQYFRCWRHFLCYLFRASTDPASSRLNLTEEQTKMIDDLKVSMDNSTEETETVVKRQLFRLSVHIFEQPITSWAMNSPLIHFLSIHAINQRDRTWSTPQEFTPTLSALIYVGRILMIEKAIPLASRAHDEFVPRFQKYHQEHLISGSLSTMRELISLRAYGMTIAADQYSKPTCHWSQDLTKLYYQEHTILMEKLQGMSVIVIQEAQTELVNHLVAQPISYLQTRDPSRFADNLMWATNEQCFTDMDENDLKDGGERVLHWFTEGGKLGSMLATSGPTRFAPRSVRSYIDRVENFLDMLMFLCHALGGMPARGTEFMSLKIRNSWTTMRNFYVVDGTLMFLTEYHKSQGRTEMPKLIPRFVPRQVAQLLIAYIADVQPFVDFLEVATELGTRTTSKHVMWSWKQKTRDTEHLSRIIGKFTEEHLGVRLTVASWRQVVITVERDRIRASKDAEQLVEDEQLSDLQAGHSEAVAEHHYGVRADLLSSLSDLMIRRMRAVSMRWHQFMLPNNSTPQQPTLIQAVVPAIIPSQFNSIDDQFRTPALKRKRGRSDACKEDELTRALSEHNPPLSDFRSQPQRRATQELIQGNKDQFTILPTAGGKTLVYYIFVKLNPSSMIVVVVPFTALLASLMQYFRQQGVCAKEWKKGTTQMNSIMLVAAESATSGDFIAYARKATDLGVLELVVFEEAHVIVKDALWREDMPGLHKLADIGRKKLFLSGTLPPQSQGWLEAQFNLVRPITVWMSTARLNISYSVEIIKDEGFEETCMERVRQLIETVEPSGRTIIYPGSVAESERISRLLGCHLYYSEYEAKSTELERWLADQGSTIMVVTAALGTGISINRILLTIHINPYNSATNFIQESGRAG